MERFEIKALFATEDVVTRCGSVTFEGKQRTVLFSNTLRPLRYYSER